MLAYLDGNGNFISLNEKFKLNFYTKFRHFLAPCFWTKTLSRCQVSSAFVWLSCHACQMKTFILVIFAMTLTQHNQSNRISSFLLHFQSIVLLLLRDGSQCCSDGAPTDEHGQRTVESTECQRQSTPTSLLSRRLHIGIEEVQQIWKQQWKS